MVRRICARVGLLALVAAAPVGAQTNDAYWSVWTGREERLSARAQALGGAAVALGDDSAAAATNPALLATLRRSEVVGGYTSFGRSNFGTIGGGGLLKSGIALGGYVRRPTTIRETDLERRLEYELTEGGFMAAGKWGRVAGGATVYASRLALTAEALSQEAGGPLRAGGGAGSTRVGATAGLAWVDGPWTVGASFRTGSKFSADRTSTLDGLTDDAGSKVEVERPWLLAMGLSYQGVKVGVFGQVDVRQAGTIRTVANRGPSTGTYDAETGGVGAVRGGLQYALLLGGVSVVPRVGVTHLAEAGIRYAGPSSGETMLFAGTEARTRPTFGLGLVFRNGVSLDAAVSDESTVAVEGRIRF